MTMQSTVYKPRIEEGKEYVFEIVNIQGEVQTSGSSYRPFIFNHSDFKEPRKINLFPFDQSQLLKALGYKEEVLASGEKSIQWDDDEVIGQNIKATVIFKKFKTQDGEEKSALNLINFREA